MPQQIQTMSKDMLMIVGVRDKMRQQWDEDICRNQVAHRVVNRVHGVDNVLTLLKKVDFANNNYYLFSNFPL